MLKKKLRGKSKFLRKMNELMEIYSRNQDTAFAYRELLGLEFHDPVRRRAGNV